MNCSYIYKNNIYTNLDNLKLVISQEEIRDNSKETLPYFESALDLLKNNGEVIPHEYAHHYIAWFRNTPLVQEAIKKWGSEEALVQVIGEQSAKQKGKAWKWWQEFKNWMIGLFSDLNNKDKEELKNIITDAFLQGVDLETGQVGISEQRSRELAERASELKSSKQFQKLTSEEKAKTIEQVTKEHRSITALKDLSAKLAHRIGGRVEFENNPNTDWKGYNQGNTSVLNEAYMTPDTPFHEILAHPIIRAIKKSNPELYQSLLKELETGRGKEIFEQVKRDYKYKDIDIIQNLKGSEIFKQKIQELKNKLNSIPENKNVDKNDFTIKYENKVSNVYLKDALITTLKGNASSGYTFSIGGKNFKTNSLSYQKQVIDNIYDAIKNLQSERSKLKESLIKQINDYSENFTVVYNAGNTKKGKFFISSENSEIQDNLKYKELVDLIGKENLPIYSLEEQQEEAIVTLLGELAAGKLEEKENASLKKKLLEFWKQISDFVKSLLRQDGIKIDELPISTTLNDLAEIMAYGNNKIILPGYKVEYSTPLGNKYDTLEEVNNEIRELADANVEVDLSNVKVNTTPFTNEESLELDYLQELSGEKSITEEQEKRRIELLNKSYNQLLSFIEKDKEYAQSREIIEQWKKENNIQYDPEEVYSRGQEFYHIKDAYFDSAKDTELWVQGLLGILDDYERAGTRMELSFATAPQGEVGKGMRGMPEARRNGTLVYITAYPQSEDIVMASKVDNNTSSFGHLNGLEKSFTNRDNTVTGIALTKSVPLYNLNTIEPNLADTIDDVAHHNESVIALTKSNFRIHYGENVTYEVKQIIDNVNKILDDKYGKLEKVEISKKENKNRYRIEADNTDPFGNNDVYGVDDNVYHVYDTENNKLLTTKNNKADAEKWINKRLTGKQPTQTKENTTSIESVLDKFNKNDRYVISDEMGYVAKDNLGNTTDIFNDIKKAENQVKLWQETNPNDGWRVEKVNKLKEKEYTSQAETNLKIAALKEVARKYPRSLITSKVVPIDKNLVQSGEVQYSKIPSAKDLQNEISEYLQGMDESIALEYDNLLSSQKQQAIEYYIEKQQNQSQKFSLAEKLEAPCEGGPNI